MCSDRGPGHTHSSWGSRKWWGIRGREICAPQSARGREGRQGGNAGGITHGQGWYVGQEKPFTYLTEYVCVVCVCVCACSDDQCTVRVTNLSEEAQEMDLKELFSHFGHIKRTFLAKDKITQQSKVSTELYGSLHLV